MLAYVIGMQGDSSNTITVYLTLGLSAVTTLVLISAKLRELLAPLGRWFTGRSLRRVQRDDAVEDARVTDLSQQVSHLSRRVTALEAEAAAHRQMVVEHVKWDVYAIIEAGKAGVTLDPPPSMLTSSLN